MRVYFLSYLSAALKLNGQYLGIIDGFDRHVELDTKDKIFAEITPADNSQGVNFIIDGDFFKTPPTFADVYTLDGDALVYIKRYPPKDSAVKVIYQTRFNGNLITVFSQGEVMLSIEGADFILERLPRAFLKARGEIKRIGNLDILAIFAEGYLCLISQIGSVVFLNEVKNYEFGEQLKITSAFETCAQIQVDCAFDYDGSKLTLTSSKTYETREITEKILPFAFFESVLSHADCKKYLSDELKPKSGDLKGFLGDFIGVCAPHELFYIKHGNINCAGLIYPEKRNLFTVKYYAVDIENGKISNIYPVE